VRICRGRLGSSSGFDEYVLLEEMSTVKHEFLDGEVWAMAGGTPDHAAIAGNVITLLSAGLRGKRCRVFTSDLRIRVMQTGLGTYPDASVICDRIELDPEDHKGHTAVNPTVLVEVLSPSTEDYDRGEKLDHYKRIPSLREVMLVAHETRQVIVWRHSGESWVSSAVGDGGVVELESVGCVLPVEQIHFDPLSRQED
jgi:Uma2 family endonuclease